MLIKCNVKFVNVHMLCLIFSSLLWWVWSIAIFMSVGLSVLAYLKNRMSKVREICYLWLWFSLLMTMQHVVDSIWAMSIVWRTRRKIVVTVLCCIVYNSCAQWYAKNGLRYAIRPLSCPVCLWRWCIVAKRLDGSRCGPSSITERGTASITFWPMSVVAKWSPISATAELLFCY